MVVDTGKWLPGRRVLVSPSSVTGIDWAARRLSVNLTCAQVRDSPDTLTDVPVSRQHEVELSAYYGWPSYWAMDPFGLMPPPLPPPAAPLAGKGDPHLRSAHEVKGYHVAALDGPVGHVSDFVFDDAAWRIVFLIVDAGSWLHDTEALLKPDWVEGIAWDERRVAVSLTREAVRSSPRFTPVFPIPAEYEEELLKHYGRSR